MAAQWITNGIANGIASSLSGTVSTAVSAAGGFAGGAATSVGNGINGVGRSIEGTVRGYGDGVINYGNAIKDWTGASGPRASTAANPLGLSDNAGGGKRALTYGAPKNAIASKPAQKALPAPSVKSNASTAPKPKAQVSTSGQSTKGFNLTPSTTPGAKKSGASTYAPSVAGSTRTTATKRVDVHKRAPVNKVPGAGAASTSAKRAAAYKPRVNANVPSGAASNPLGLSGF